MQLKQQWCTRLQLQGVAGGAGQGVLHQGECPPGFAVSPENGKLIDKTDFVLNVLSFVLWVNASINSKLQCPPGQAFPGPGPSNF